MDDVNCVMTHDKKEIAAKIVGSKYYTHVLPRLEEVYEWLKAGMTEYSIAEKLGISQDTLTRYKKEYSEFTELYARATRERNCLVMNSMFGKAVGIKEKVPKAFKIKEVQYDEKGKKAAEIERLEYAEEYIYIPPDVNAADLYLRNNDPDYKTTKSVETSNITINNFQLPQLEQELQQIAEKRKMLEMQLGVDFEVHKED